MTCLPLESLAAWILGDLDGAEGDRVEEHLFVCDTCATRAQRLEELRAHLGAMVPAWLTPGRRRELEALMPAMQRVAISPGEHGTIELARQNPVGIWVMRAELTGVERLDCQFLTGDGTVLKTFPDVPFDANRGELVLACQTHYRALGFPEDLMIVRVEAVSPSGRSPVGEYLLKHVYSED